MTARKSIAYEYTICSLFAALTAVGAFIKIPLPPPLVDFTLQFLFVVMAGFILGSKKGPLAILIYLIIGLLGVPVFTRGGGIQYIFQPTFGYLLSFVVCAYITGKFRESGKLTFVKLLLGSLVGLLVVYIIGVAYMYLIYNYYLGQSVAIWALIYGGAIICAPGDIFLAIVASSVSMKVIPILKRQHYIV